MGKWDIIQNVIIFKYMFVHTWIIILYMIAYITLYKSIYGKIISMSFSSIKNIYLYIFYSVNIIISSGCRFGSVSCNQTKKRNCIMGRNCLCVCKYQVCIYLLVVHNVKYHFFYWVRWNKQNNREGKSGKNSQKITARFFISILPCEYLCIFAET